MRKSLEEFCLETGAAALLEQWDAAGNAPLTAGDISYGSKQKVWWRCEKGHRWQAPPYARTGSETGCPYCAGKRVLPGENDLASAFPEVAAQWHPTKNGALTPRDVLPGSHRKVWWQCEKGHVWQAQVKSRVHGCGCPVCANRELAAGENDLLARFPQIAAQWHPTKNGTLRPEQMTSNSNRKVWWLCPLGHAYQAVVAARTAQSSGCPYCAGKRVLPGFNDLETRFPQVAAQWHPTLNGTLTPAQVLPGSHRKVWWQCAEGHAWKAVIYSRTTKRKSGCPVCAGVAGGRRRRPGETVPVEVAL